MEPSYQPFFSSASSACLSFLCGAAASFVLSVAVAFFLLLALNSSIVLAVVFITMKYTRGLIL